MSTVESLRGQAATQTNPAEPSVAESATAPGTIAEARFSEATFLQRDPGNYAEFKQLEAELFEQYVAVGNGSRAESELAAQKARLTALTRFRTEAEAAGALTVVRTVPPGGVEPARAVTGPAPQNTNATGVVAEDSTSLPALERRLVEEQARRADTVRELADTDDRIPFLQRELNRFQPRDERDNIIRELNELTAQKELLETQTIPEIDRDIRELQALIEEERARREELLASGEFQPPITPDPNQASAEAAVIAADFEFAASQAAVAEQRRQACEGDWRVKLRLAGNATYLYKAADPGILAPLRDSDGVIFPYTPQITTNYATNYSTYDLTHSNYRGYFYQNSYVSEITVDATFTAQDTFEANYLLAVIHFFRSATKMFYGQESNQYRGAPPPLVFLQGLGEFQFNLAPCLIQNFNYVLPSDVDYIRANAADGLSSLRRDSGVPANQQGLSTPSSALRLTGARIPVGGIPQRGRVVSTGGPCNITYVPTKMQISLTLYPVQTRSQVSREFSFSDYANGRLIKRGFW